MIRISLQFYSQLIEELFKRKPTIVLEKGLTNPLQTDTLWLLVSCVGFSI